MHTSHVLRLWITTAFAIPSLALATSLSRADCPYVWRAGDGRPGMSGPVYAIGSWDPDGSGPESKLLVAGGAFGYVGNLRVNGIAAWNGSRWQGLGGGLQPSFGTIRSVADFGG